MVGWNLVGGRGWHLSLGSLHWLPQSAPDPLRGARLLRRAPVSWRTVAESASRHADALDVLSRSLALWPPFPTLFQRLIAYAGAFIILNRSFL